MFPRCREKKNIFVFFRYLPSRNERRYYIIVIMAISYNIIALLSQHVNLIN